MIQRCGLEDCGELLALATTEQLSAVFDLDLWRTDRHGEELFDASRFCSWLEVLADLGAAADVCVWIGRARLPQARSSRRISGTPG